MHHHKQKPNQLKLHSIPISKFMLHGFSYSIPLLCVVALLLLGFSAIMPQSKAALATDSLTTRESVAIGNASIALGVGQTNLLKEVSANDVNFIFTNLNVQTIDIKDYAIYIRAADGYTGNLVGDETGATIPGVGSNVATSSFTGDQWGYSLTEGIMDESGLNSLLYSTVPEHDASNITPAYSQQTLGEAKDGKDFTLAFAANFGFSILPDHYKTSVLVSIAASPSDIVKYSVTYDANGGTGTPPSEQSIESAEDTYEFTVAGQGNLTRPGYRFLGWAETNTATSAQYIAGSSKVTLSKITPTKTLYAVWSKEIFSGITTMQQLTKSVCNAATENETKKLTDTRDSKTYQVTKLKDGNCWMTQNLDYDGYGTKYTNASSWTNSGSQAMFYDPGDSTTGNYYNWQAATQGTGSQVTTRGENASGSICPSGWILPPSSGNGSFANLVTDLGYGSALSSALRAAPYNLKMSGYVYSNDTHGIDQQFFYWTSTYYNSSTPYVLSGNSTSVDTARVNSIGRDFGFNVRCLVLGS